MCRDLYSLPLRPVGPGVEIEILRDIHVTIFSKG